MQKYSPKCVQKCVRIFVQKYKGRERLDREKKERERNKKRERLFVCVCLSDVILGGVFGILYPQTRRLNNVKI